MADEIQREYEQPNRLPIPDPTERTIEALRRDIGALRALLEEKIESNRELIQQTMAERELRYEQRFIAQENALAKQAQAYDKRFENVNEFRSQLSDQAGTFMPRQEYQAKHDALIDKVDAGNKTLSDRIDINAKGLSDAVTSLQLSRAGDTGEKTARLDVRSAVIAVAGVFFGLAGFVFGIIRLVQR